MSFPFPVTRESEGRKATGSAVPTHPLATRADVPVESPESLISKAKIPRREQEVEVLNWIQRNYEQRTELILDRLKNMAASSTGPMLQGSDELIDEYLGLAAKREGISKRVKALTGECVPNHSDCDCVNIKVFKASPRPRENLSNEDTRSLGRTYSEAVAKRILVTEPKAVNVGAAIGAFGAGIAYTTLFSATRGRLDLISCAFACFLIVIINCAVFQILLADPEQRRHASGGHRKKLMAPSRLFVFGFWIGLPTVSGCLLLAVSVAVLDNTSDSPDPGSQVAIRAAGYLGAASLGYLVMLQLIDAFLTTTSVWGMHGKVVRGAVALTGNRRDS